MFKKMGILSIVAILSLSSVPCFAASQPYDFYKQVDLTIGVKEAIVNKTAVTMDQPAYVSEGRTLVPFRFLGESLGAQVAWDAATSQAKLNLSGIEVVVTVGSLNGMVDGKVVKMDVPAVNKDGRLFIPLRFVSENLGALVNYNPETKGIRVSRVDTTKWISYEAPNNLKYMHPAGWVMAPSKEDANVMEMTLANGSTLSTYASDKIPGSLMAELMESYEDGGWTYETVIMDDEKDINEGYEMRFYTTEKNGSRTIVHVFVDPLGDGSNVGEAIANETNDLIDAQVLYVIVSS